MRCCAGKRSRTLRSPPPSGPLEEVGQSQQLVWQHVRRWQGGKSASRTWRTGSRAGRVADEEQGGTMSGRSIAGVCGFLVGIGWLAVPAAWPQQKEAKAPADPVQQ